MIFEIIKLNKELKWSLLKEAKELHILETKQSTRTECIESVRIAIMFHSHKKSMELKSREHTHPVTHLLVNRE